MPARRTLHRRVEAEQEYTGALTRDAWREHRTDEAEGISPRRRAARLLVMRPAWYELPEHHDVPGHLIYAAPHRNRLPDGSLIEEQYVVDVDGFEHLIADPDPASPWHVTCGCGRLHTSGPALQAQHQHRYSSSIDAVSCHGQEGGLWDHEQEAAENERLGRPRRPHAPPDTANHGAQPYDPVTLAEIADRLQVAD